MLHSLLEYAVTAFKLLTDEKRRIRHIMAVFTNKFGSSQHLLVDSCQRADLHHSGLYMTIT